MYLTWKRRRFSIRPGSAYLALAGLIFIALYGVFLTYQERLAEARLAAMRQKDADAYLDEIRMLEGFDTYVREFQQLKGFDSFRTNAPIFMIGRWTLRDSTERIPVGTMPDCTDPVIFEYGRFKLPRDGTDLPASFRLDDQTLIVRPRTGDPVRVELISFGAAIDHLRLTPPGREDVSYAYPCGR